MGTGTRNSPSRDGSRFRYAYKSSTFLVSRPPNIYFVEFPGRLLQRRFYHVQVQAKICGDGFDNLRSHTPLLSGVRRDECVFADGVDQPRNAAGMAINSRDGFWKKYKTAIRTWPR